MDEPDLRDFTDRALCNLLAKPENLREFLGAAVPQLVDGFDFDRMKPAPQEFLIGNWRRRKPDVLVEIPYRFDAGERWALVCVLLEHQTKSDWQVPLKTFQYAAMYWEWQWRKWESTPSPRPDFMLTPVLPIVLHTGTRPWGSARTLRDLLGPPELFHSFAPSWQPVFWELATHSAEELIDGPTAFMQAMAIIKAENAELAQAEDLFKRIFVRIDPLHESGRVRWRDLLEFLLGWAQNRRPKTEQATWINVAVDLQADTDRRREIQNMGMTIAQSLIEEGRIEGELRHARRTLLRLGRKRLGSPSESTQAAVSSLADLDRLDRMTERLDEVKSWDELLRTE